MPQPGIERGYSPGPAGELGFTGIWLRRIVVSVLHWMTRLLVAPRDDDRAAVLLREIRKHPHGDDVQHGIRIRCRDVRGAVLVVRPIGMQGAARYSCAVHDARKHRDTDM